MGAIVHYCHLKRAASNTQKLVFGTVCETNIFRIVVKVKYFPAQLHAWTAVAWVQHMQTSSITCRAERVMCNKHLHYM